MLFRVNEETVYDTQKMSPDDWVKLGLWGGQQKEIQVLIPLAQWGVDGRSFIAKPNVPCHLSAPYCPVCYNSPLHIYYLDKGNSLFVVDPQIASNHELNHLVASVTLVEIERTIVEDIFSRHHQVIIPQLVGQIRYFKRVLDELVLKVEEGVSHLEKTKGFVRSPNIGMIRIDLAEAVSQARRARGI